MPLRKRQIGALLPILILLLTGCASGGFCAPVVNTSITPSAVSSTDSHLGEIVHWGGTLVAIHHRRDSTELGVVAYPLDSCGRPSPGSPRTGRFIIVHPGFLETADFQAGQRVTATGRITGIREGTIVEEDDSLPLIESYNVQLWPDQQIGGDYTRPWLNIGIGGGSGGVYGSVGVIF
jgi:outer membrane lipoprotein